MGQFGQIQTTAEYALKNNLSATTNPSVNDDSTQGYEPGSVWINNTTQIAYICVSSSVANAIWQQQSNFQSQNFGLYAQTADSTPVVNTLVPGSLIGSGVGTLSVSANQFKVGDAFYFTMGGKKSNINNNNIKIDLTANGGSVILASSGLINLSGATNQPWEITTEFTIRAIGIAGVASIHTNSKFLAQADAGLQFEGKIFDDNNNTTFDTTISNTLDVLISWDIASPNNSIYTDNFVLNKIY